MAKSTKSYENGSIDNTKKMVLEGLSEALHVSVEWLKGETDEYETDIRLCQIQFQTALFYSAAYQLA